MSTSLLYHGWGLKGYRYVRSHYGGGKLIFTVKPNPRSLTCPVCHCRDILLHGSIYRMWREVSIGCKPVFIQMGIPRIEWRECSTIRQVADQRRTYTRGFERYALELSRHMTIIDVARHLNVGWDLGKDIQKRYLHKHFSRPKLKDLRQIAIDEISIVRGQKYLTVVLDLDTGAMVFVGDLTPGAKKISNRRTCGC